jgi:hypothetical protein
MRLRAQRGPIHHSDQTIHIFTSRSSILFLSTLVVSGVRIFMVNFNLYRLRPLLRCLWATNTPRVFSFVFPLHCPVLPVVPTKQIHSMLSPHAIPSIPIPSHFHLPIPLLQSGGARRTAAHTDTLRCLSSRSRPGFNSPHPNFECKFLFFFSLLFPSFCRRFCS